ncbi:MULTISPECIES: hypothetical protein [unclassified Variovorax]|uniref:hypothetical protein n=1 Tax=unclassified Variovorax TaxID=663243 RepID=UPI0032E7ACA3
MNTWLTFTSALRTKLAQFPVGANNQYGVIAGGAGNVVSADFGQILGGTSNTASGDYAVNVGGLSCQATGNRSRVGGAYGSTRGIHMADVFGTSSTLGKHQRENHGLQANTVDATPTVAFAFTGSPSTSNQVTLQNNSAMTFSALVTAKKSGSTDTAHFKVEGGGSSRHERCGNFYRGDTSSNHAGGGCRRQRLGCRRHCKHDFGLPDDNRHWSGSHNHRMGRAIARLCCCPCIDRQHSPAPNPLRRVF